MGSRSARGRFVECPAKPQCGFTSVGFTQHVIHFAQPARAYPLVQIDASPTFALPVAQFSPSLQFRIQRYPRPRKGNLILLCKKIGNECKNDGGIIRVQQFPGGVFIL
jgi:hypothetical protein